MGYISNQLNNSPTVSWNPSAKSGIGKKSVLFSNIANVRSQKQTQSLHWGRLASPSVSRD